MIKYHLVENHLTERADDYNAQVQSAGSFDMDAIVERMLQRGSLITKTDILAVINSFEETVLEVIKEGNTVAIPLLHTGFSISGVFEGATDSFDPNRHKLNITIAKGTKLKELQQNVKLEKTASVAPSNNIVEVKDSVTGSVNDQFTVGGVLEVYGANIKVMGDRPECGVYFVAASGEATKVTTLVQNNPSTLIVLVPPMEAGAYTVKVVTQYGSNSSKLLKEPRTVLFDRSLTAIV